MKSRLADETRVTQESRLMEESRVAARGKVGEGCGLADETRGAQESQLVEETRMQQGRLEGRGCALAAGQAGEHGQECRAVHVAWGMCRCRCRLAKCMKSRLADKTGVVQGSRLMEDRLEGGAGPRQQGRGTAGWRGTEQVAA